MVQTGLDWAEIGPKSNHIYIYIYVNYFELTILSKSVHIGLDWTKMDWKVLNEPNSNYLYFKIIYIYLELTVRSRLIGPDLTGPKSNYILLFLFYKNESLFSIKELDKVNDGFQVSLSWFFHGSTSCSNMEHQTWLDEVWLPLYRKFLWERTDTWNGFNLLHFL